MIQDETASSRTRRMEEEGHNFHGYILIAFDVDVL